MKSGLISALLLVAFSAHCENLRIDIDPLSHSDIVRYNISHGHKSLFLGIPTTNNVDVIYDNDSYAVGYSKFYKQPVWTIYQLTDREVKNSGKFGRDDFVFRSVPVGPSNFSSASSSDYNGSGYDRGHMVPAGDMSWSMYGLEDSFYMFNICPQTPICNRGVWKRLEAWVRDNTLIEEKMIIVSGPIFSTNALQKTIGKNKVIVPEAFFKVIYDTTPPVKMIGFVVPNEGCTNSLDTYTKSVDEIERLTGMTFFKDDRCETKPDKTATDLSLWNWNANSMILEKKRTIL